jgi:hypothetical protein
MPPPDIVTSTSCGEQCLPFSWEGKRCKALAAFGTCPRGLTVAWCALSRRVAHQTLGFTRHGARVLTISPTVHHVRDVRPSPESAQRKSVAGRAGFLLGCLAAIIATTLNLLRAPRPLSMGVIFLSVLIAALNIPLGIGLALLVERLSRGESEK